MKRIHRVKNPCLKVGLICVAAFCMIAGIAEFCIVIAVTVENVTEEYVEDSVPRGLYYMSAAFIAFLGILLCVCAGICIGSACCNNKNISRIAVSISIANAVVAGILFCAILACALTVKFVYQDGSVDEETEYQMTLVLSLLACINSVLSLLLWIMCTSYNFCKVQRIEHVKTPDMYKKPKAKKVKEVHHHYHPPPGGPGKKYMAGGPSEQPKGRQINIPPGDHNVKYQRKHVRYVKPHAKEGDIKTKPQDKPGGTAVKRGPEIETPMPLGEPPPYDYSMSQYSREQSSGLKEDPRVCSTPACFQVSPMDMNPENDQTKTSPFNSKIIRSGGSTRGSQTSAFGPKATEPQKSPFLTEN